MSTQQLVGAKWSEDCMHPTGRGYIHLISSFSVPEWPILNTNKWKIEEAIIYMGLLIYQSKKL